MPPGFKVWFALCLVLGLSTLDFVVWIILKLLHHFGVI